MNPTRLPLYCRKKFTSQLQQQIPNIICAQVGPKKSINSVHKHHSFGDYRERLLYSNDRLDKTYPSSHVFKPDERDWSQANRKIAQQSFDDLEQSLIGVCKQANSIYVKEALACTNTLFFLNFHEHALCTRAPMPEAHYKQLLQKLLACARTLDDNFVAVIPTLYLQLDAPGLNTSEQADTPKLLKAVSLGIQGGANARILMQSAKRVTSQLDPFYDYPNGRFFTLNPQPTRYQFQIGGPLTYNSPVLNGNLASGAAFTIFVDICITHALGLGLHDFSDYWQGLTDTQRQAPGGFSHHISSNSIHLVPELFAATHVVYNDSQRMSLCGKLQPPVHVAPVNSRHAIASTTPFLMGHEIAITQSMPMGSPSQALLDYSDQQTKDTKLKSRLA